MSTEQPNVIGFDTETERFGLCNLAPQIVCLSVSPEEDEALLVGISDGETPGSEMDEYINLLFEGSSIRVAHNTAFDLAVLCRHRPELFPVVFQALENGQLSDTIIREKLLNITTHGQLEFTELPGGGSMPIKYALSDLVMKYFGIDITAGKEGDDAWRTNYSVLASTPSDQWPQEAQDYAKDDSVWARKLWFEQEARRQLQITETGIDPFKVESFRVAVDFCLYLMSAWGTAVDPIEKARIEDMLAEELRPEKLKHLLEAEILRPAQPPQPHKSGAKSHVGGCKKKWKDEAGNQVVCDCPLKMSKGTKESKDTKKLHAYVKKLAKSNSEIQLKYTKASDKFPEGQLSVNAEFMDEYWHLDVVLEELRHREKLQKLVTTEIPRMNLVDAEGISHTSPIVHPCYDILKKTGRTSSYGSKHYPSYNCQNVDPRARNCFVPREGTLFFGIDYAGMELGTLGQKCLDLFGHSVLAGKINAGIDTHAYLGSQLAHALDGDFSESCTEEGAVDADAIYEAFASCKDCGDAEVEKFFKHYRKFAKPTGLGFPGGLGPKTFVQYAKGTFGVLVDKDTAKQLREIWHRTYPEMEQYFEWINNDCEDTRNGPRIVVKDGIEQKRSRYAYTTPMGMYRAGADYCAAANGAALQSPSAEGALLGLFNIVRACYDPTMNSILYGDVKPIMFVHDEIIGEVPDDDLAHERVEEMRRVMVEAMSQITPDVKPSTEAVLMKRWDKRAEPVFDEAGKLTVWSPDD